MLYEVITYMKNFLFWTIAVVITVAAAIYQRTTGPSYPYRTTSVIDGTEYSLRLKRSQTNTHPCLIKLAVSPEITGELFFRKYKMNGEWSMVVMKHDGEHLAGELPSQPAAGKLEYYVVLTDTSGIQTAIMRDNPVVIRFKGNVPAVIMIRITSYNVCYTKLLRWCPHVVKCFLNIDP